MMDVLYFTVNFPDGQKVYLYSTIDPVVAAVAPLTSMEAAIQTLREWLATPEAVTEIMQNLH